MFSATLIVRAKGWEPISISRRLAKSILAEFYDRIKCSYRAMPYALMGDLPVTKANCRIRVHSMLAYV